jgi:hypothetical protein
MNLSPHVKRVQTRTKTKRTLHARRTERIGGVQRLPAPIITTPVEKSTESARRAASSDPRHSPNLAHENNLVRRGLLPYVRRLRVQGSRQPSGHGSGR